MKRKQKSSNLRAAWYVCSGTLVFVAVLTWFLYPAKTQLPGDTYDIAIALYRVCNQQDDQGLLQIQSKLDELKTVVATDDPAITLLQRIVDDAQAGSWTSAMRDARSTLEDQSSDA